MKHAPCLCGDHPTLHTPNPDHPHRDQCAGPGCHCDKYIPHHGGIHPRHLTAAPTEPEGDDSPPTRHEEDYAEDRWARKGVI